MTLRLPLFLAAALALSALMLSPGCQVFTADDDSGADGIATASGRTVSESTLADVIASNSVSGAMIAVPTLTVVNDDPLQFMGLVEARVAEYPLAPCIWPKGWNSRPLSSWRVMMTCSRCNRVSRPPLTRRSLMRSSIRKGTYSTLRVPAPEIVCWFPALGLLPNFFMI